MPNNIKKPGWGAFLPRFNIPETFGAAISYEGQLHWFLENWDNVAEYANALEQPTIDVGATTFPDTSNALKPSIVNVGTDINAVLDFSYPVIRTRFADPFEWDIDTSYDLLTVVGDGSGNSYTSIRDVPAGVPLSNTDFWAPTGIYDSTLNATIQDLRAVESTYVKCYDTVTSMVADSTLIAGMRCHVNGQSSIGDGGSGVYKIYDIADMVSSDLGVSGGYVVARLIRQDYTVTLNDYPGDSAEDRLFAALDELESGVIVCGDVAISKKYTAKNKDYRLITIACGNITLGIDNFFDQADSTYHSVPKFSSCYIRGIDPTYSIYAGGNNCIGPMFISCTLDSVRVYNDSTHYVQSLYLSGCELQNVRNLVTAYNFFDLKMIGCRVESAVGVLIEGLHATNSITQGAIIGCLIEGRSDVVIRAGGANGLFVSGCYFEALNGGLIEQTGTNGTALIHVTDNAFYGSMSNTDVAVRIASSASSNLRIGQNVSNIIGKGLTNIRFNPLFDRYGLNSNFYSNGFSGHPGGYSVGANGLFINTNSGMVLYDKCVWNADTSTWDITLQMPYGEFYSVHRPLYIFFVGRYGGSAAYVGYEIVRVCTRTGGSPLQAIVDVEIVDGCNTASVEKTNTATVSATISDTRYNSVAPSITVSISGFHSGNARCKVYDVFGITSYFYDRLDE